MNGLDDAPDRAAAFAVYDADITFIEAPETVGAIRLIAAQTHSPQLVNVVIGGKTPSLPAEQLAAMGFGMVCMPMPPCSGALRGVSNVLQHLRTHGELKEAPALVATFSERQSLVQKPFYDELERFYV